MTDETRQDLLKMLEDVLAKVKADPNYGFELLVGAGILDENHSLTEPYKGLCTKEDPD